MSGGPRIIEVLREFTIWAKCMHCGKPSNLQGRWIRLSEVNFLNEKIGNKVVDAEVMQAPCPWCQGRGMTNAGKLPRFEIPKSEVMSYYKDAYGPIKSQGFLRN
jgi:hypothetical protein